MCVGFERCFAHQNAIAVPDGLASMDELQLCATENIGGAEQGCDSKLQFELTASRVADERECYWEVAHS